MKAFTVKLSRDEVETLLRLLGKALHARTTVETQKAGREELALWLRLTTLEKAETKAWYNWEELPAWADEACWAALRTADQLPNLERQVKEAQHDVKVLRGKLGVATKKLPAPRSSRGKGSKRGSASAAAIPATSTTSPSAPRVARAADATAGTSATSPEP